MFIRAKQLTKRVTVGSKSLTILQDVSLNIESGTSVAIVGVSGSGKTTLLGLLAGLDLPTEGQVIFNGVDLNSIDENERANIRLQNIGFVFQNFQLLPNLTAVENVMLPLELKGQSDAKRRALEFLEKVGLQDRSEHYATQLSGGEQQRVAIARAFAVKPKVLFTDEPTANLDQKTGTTIIELLFELNKQFHTTLVCVTHDPLIGKRCDQVLSLSEGRLNLEPT